MADRRRIATVEELASGSTPLSGLQRVVSAITHLGMRPGVGEARTDPVQAQPWSAPRTGNGTAGVASVAAEPVPARQSSPPLASAPVASRGGPVPGPGTVIIRAHLRLQRGSYVGPTATALERVRVLSSRQTASTHPATLSAAEGVHAEPAAEPVRRHAPLHSSAAPREAPSPPAVATKRKAQASASAKEPSLVAKRLVNQVGAFRGRFPVQFSCNRDGAVWESQGTLRVPVSSRIHLGGMSDALDTIVQMVLKQQPEGAKFTVGEEGVWLNRHETWVLQIESQRPVQ
jgi:hypothetical protein